MGEYKLLIRFDANKRLTEAHRAALREQLPDFLDKLSRSQSIGGIDVIYVKILNVIDKKGD